MLHSTKTRWPTKLLPVVSPLALISLWWVVDHLGLISPLYLPSFSETVSSVGGFFSSDGILHLCATLRRTMVGFVLASLMGVSLGLCIGLNEKLYLATEIVIDFFRSLPATAFIPLFLLFFGIGDVTKVSVASFTVVWTVLVNTISGVRSVSQTRIRVGRLFRASAYQLVREVVVFEALPQIFLGLRLAVSLSLVIVIVTETFVGAKHGVGKSLYDGYVTYRVPQVYAAIFIAGGMGYMLNKLFAQIEKRWIHWVGQ